MDRTAAGQVESAEHIEQRRLAAAAGAEHHRELAGHDVDVDPERVAIGGASAGAAGAIRSGLATGPELAWLAGTGSSVAGVISGVLDAVKESGQVPDDRFTQVAASISFFVNAGIRFVEETCKMRVFTAMWDDLLRDRYGITDPKARRFRYGVQVNSLGLTEAQPENNVQRIVLEALGVTLSKNARARSLQLPAWNEALGLPRPWDQQWSLRIQQVLAYETDLLEYEDIFDGSHVIEGRTNELIDAAQAELDEVLEMGGAFEAIEELKGRLVASHAERVRKIETGDHVATAEYATRHLLEELAHNQRYIITHGNCREAILDQQEALLAAQAGSVSHNRLFVEVVTRKCARNDSAAHHDHAVG